MSIALDDERRVLVNLRVPGESVFGTERAPANEEEESDRRAALRDLEGRAGELVGWDRAVGCVAQSVHVQVNHHNDPHDNDHAAGDHAADEEHAAGDPHDNDHAAGDHAAGAPHDDDHAAGDHAAGEEHAAGDPHDGDPHDDDHAAGDHPADEEHSDVTVDVAYTCAADPAGATVSVHVMRVLPQVVQVHVTLLLPDAQRTAVVEADGATIEFR